MLLSLSSALSGHIRFLLQSLDETNSEDIFRELCLDTDYGTEGSIFLLQTCLGYLNLRGKDLKNTQLEPIFGSIFKHILDKPNFSTVICECLKSEAVNEDFLENLSNALHLLAPEKIKFGIALSNLENSEIRLCVKRFCMSKIEELFSSHTCVDSAEQIENIFMFLHQSDGRCKHIDSFMNMLSMVELNVGGQFILAPLLSDELCKSTFNRWNPDLFIEGSDFDSVLAEMEEEISISEIMKELGYGCTANVSQCVDILSLFLPLTEVKVSRIVSTILCTHTGLQDCENAFSTFCSVLDNGSLSDPALLSSWNIGVFVDSVKQLAPGINWISVVENLDHEGFYFPNEAAFSIFMSIYKQACQDPFPLHAICGSVWNNIKGQLSFLNHAVSVAPEVFTFAHSGRQLAYLDNIGGLELVNKNNPWLCLDLLEMLCLLAERGQGSAVRSLLKHPLKHYPEVLLLGMAHFNTAYNLLQFEVCMSVLPMILKNSKGSGILLHLWHANPNLLLWGFLDTCAIDPDAINRILDICQDLKILSPVLDMIPSHFGIRLAAIASRKELLDLEKWLRSNLITHKDFFFEECVKLLKEILFGICQGHLDNHLNHSAWNLYSETIPTFFKILQAHKDWVISYQISEEMEKLHAIFMCSNSITSSTRPSNSSSSDGYTDDVEAEANSYFRQLFSGQLAINSMIQMLVQFKNSSDKREQSVFGCVISNLYEEYKFFSRYPDNQLIIAAGLYGSLIKHGLITQGTLALALRGVVDALSKPPDSKMFAFGREAVEQFVDRLIEWPNYCNDILQISHLHSSHCKLIDFIEESLAKITSGHLVSDGAHSASIDQQHVQAGATNMESTSPLYPQMPDLLVPLSGSLGTQSGLQSSSSILLEQNPESCLGESQKISATSSGYIKPFTSSDRQPLVSTSNASSTLKVQNAASASVALSSTSVFNHPSRAITSARFGSALNIETLIAAAERSETPLEAPVSEIQDKISFIINNLSATNADAKAKEFSGILKEQYYPWFAQYMVMKRASIEPNFHDLYLKFLDKVNMKRLNREIVKATYENCKVLLRSELIKSSSEERSLLKNLGSWLGKITIGRNRVLRACDIDPKSLIIEAYEKGLMIAVIPFTSKILEPCQSSRAYKPPNPWTVAILRLLAEIYAMPNLKMNLKFDIEVLFKNLCIDLKDVTPTSLLKDRVRQVEGNPDFSSKDVGLSQQLMVGEVKSGVISTLNQVEQVASPSHPAGHSHILSQYAAPLHLSSGTLMEDQKLATLGLSDLLPVPSARGLLQRKLAFSVGQLPTPAANVEQQIIINPKLSALGLYIHFQSVGPIAICRAIKEVVSNIAQHSVSIATQTTKELVLKDYAMELDETRILNAAHLMSTSLAGSLAHITCKEPLRTSMSSQLRNSLPGLNIANELFEQAVQLVTSDNLDLGCTLIEQAAAKKAIQTIDGEMAQQLIIRRKQREAVGPVYFDSGLYVKGHAGVPEALRPKPGRLSHSQQRVYEDFIRLPWHNQTSHSSDSLPVGPSFEEMESGPDQPHSVLSIHTGATDGINLHDIQNNTPIASCPSASAPELRNLGTSNITKESGGSSQPLLSISGTQHLGTSTSEPLLSTGDALEKYQIISEKLETLVSSNGKDADIQGLIAEVPRILLRCVSRDEAALAVAQKVFKGLYESSSNSAHVAAHLGILAAIRDVSKFVVKELTSWVIYSDEDRKFNKDITLGLIQSELLNLAEYNVHMAKLLDAGRNKGATEFAISLIRTLLNSDSRVISELHYLVDALAKLAAMSGTPESLKCLVEVVKNPVGNATATFSVSAGKDNNATQIKEKKAPDHSGAGREECNVVESGEMDPAGFYEKVSMLFTDWCRLCELPGANDSAFAHYVLQLQQSGLLKGDNTQDRFFNCIMKFTMSHCLPPEVISSGPLKSPHVQPLSFLAIDIYAKLVISIVRFLPVEPGSSKFSLLPKVLAVAVKFIQKDADERKTSFNPRPYFRLFINWLLDLGSMDSVSDDIQVSTAFANAFHALQPLKVPGFSFAWLELVSHRCFMPKLLTGNGQKGWPHMQRLLVDLLQFLEPFLRNAELGEPVRLMYKGTLRVLLVLLHDFPEFLCNYHFTFCDVIPPSCIQLRNIVLSAFPPNMRLPDPSTPNLKIDLLTEMSQPPHILSAVDAALRAKQIKGDVDEYLKTRPEESSFLTGLKQRLLLPPDDAARAGTRYNVPLINSLVLYVGTQAIQQLRERTPHAESTANSAPLAVFLVGAALDIFEILMIDLDTEGRYHVLNAIANQLRYPNNHTHYFSFIILYLFGESKQEIIQEQITRVLFERLIANQPHPWGLLIVIIELIKNPTYNFWSHSFTRCAPEIEKIFESVLRSCRGAKPLDESVVTGGVMPDLH